MSTYRRRFVPLFIGVLFSLCLINAPANAQSQTARTNTRDSSAVPQNDTTCQFVHATLPAASSGLKGAKREEVLSQFGRIPAFFIENKGQTAKDVKYYFKGNDNVYFTDEGVMFQKVVREQGAGVRDQESEVEGEESRPPTPDHGRQRTLRSLNQCSAEGNQRGETSLSTAYSTLAYKLEFIGARPTTPQARNELKGKVNYLIGNDRSKWHTNISTYQEVVYHNLYPTQADSTDIKSVVYHEDSMVDNEVYLVDSNGIDLVYKGVPGGMKYEFIVQPGANPDDIRLAYTGIKGLSIDDFGNLIIHTSLGDVRDAKPYCYQETDGKQVEVEGNFVIRNDVGAGLALPNNKGAASGAPTQFVYGFQVSSYNPNYPLIIDPGLEYSTFLGGSGDDYGTGIAVDGSGYAYVTGYTNDAGTDFPTTLGAYDETHNGFTDVFVTRLNTTGTALAYSTFLGGGGDDYCLGIAVDGSGYAYVTGYTHDAATDFPTTSGAYDVTHNGLSDVFVTKLNTAGTALEYSTFLGGSGFDVGGGVAVDGSGYAYVTGYTYDVATDFPTTAGAYDETHNGVWDVFVSKLSFNSPPDCSGAYPSLSEIWPPNHKMVGVNILGVTDADGDPVTITITGITQDEPLDGLGDGNTCPDGAGVGTSTAQVRAERAGKGNGRVYEISFTASDGKGGECNGSVTVCVPHDMRPGHVCVDDGQVYDSTTCP